VDADSWNIVVKFGGIGVIALFVFYGLFKLIILDKIPPIARRDALRLLYAIIVIIAVIIILSIITWGFIEYGKLNKDPPVVTSDKTQSDNIQVDLSKLQQSISILLKPWNLKDIDPDVKELILNNQFLEAKKILDNNIKNISQKKSAELLVLAKLYALDFDMSKYYEYILKAYTENPDDIEILALYLHVLEQQKPDEYIHNVTAELKKPYISNETKFFLELTLLTNNCSPGEFYSLKKREMLTITFESLRMPREAGKSQPNLGINTNDINKKVDLIVNEKLNKCIDEISTTEMKLSAILDDKEMRIQIKYILYRNLMSLYYMAGQSDLSLKYKNEADKLITAVAGNKSPWVAINYRIVSLGVDTLFMRRDIARGNLSSLLHAIDELPDNDPYQQNLWLLPVDEAKALLKFQVYFFLALFYDQGLNTISYNYTYLPQNTKKSIRSFELAIQALANINNPGMVTKHLHLMGIIMLAYTHNSETAAIPAVRKA
jgi:hypothetical protein